MMNARETDVIVDTEARRVQPLRAGVRGKIVDVWLCCTVHNDNPRD